jgi:hypothetical protein
MRRQTPRRLHVSRRFIASGTILGLVFAFSATSVSATEVVDEGSGIAGTITSAKLHLPMVGVCVYPVISGLIQNEDALVGDYHAEQTLPGSCTDADGHYALTLPAALTASLPAVNLLVIPANNQTAGRVIAGAGPYDVALDMATSTASGYVSMSGADLVNGIVEIIDSNNTVVGAGISGKNGLWYAGISGQSAIQATARPLGVVGANLSSDLTGGATPEAHVALGVNTTFPDINIPDTAAVNGQVLVEGASPLPWQVVHADCVAGCTSGLVGITDATGAFSLGVPAGATMIIGAGGRLVKASFELGITNLAPVKTVPNGGRNISYRQAPAAWFASQSRISLNRSVTWSWTGASLESAPYEFRKSRALGTWRTPLSEYSDPVSDITGFETASLAFGQTRCDRVKTVTALAGISSTVQGAATTQCVSVPLDERVLAASKAWRKSAPKSAFNHTLLTTSSIRATLALSGVTGHQLMVVFARSPKGGSFSVSINGKIVKAVSTAGVAATGLLAIGPVKAFKNAKVVIATTNGKPVAIDGVAFLP